MDEPVVGYPVVDADGRDVGTVKEVRGGYFKVDAPMARDFWLSSAYVASVDAGVRLSLSGDEVEEHHLDEPGLEPSADPDAADVQDAILSPEEALSQRERMERELEEQRRARAS